MRNSNCLYALAMLAAALPALGQTVAAKPAPAAASSKTVVPFLVPYASAASGLNENKQAIATFLIFKEETGGESLWMETQTVEFDVTGHYQVYLGAASTSGLPADLFSSGDARWLEVQIAGMPPQRRVLLTSVPYAMKAADAETLAGVPATSFVTQSQLAAAAAALTAQAAQRILPETTPSGSGAANYLAYWTGAATLGDSAIYQAGTAAAPLLGIGTASPVTTLDVKGAATVRGTLNVPPLTAATTAAAVNSPMLEIGASIFDSTTSAAVTDTYAWQAVSLGNNTTAPRANLNLYYIAGTAAPVPTGFSVNSIGEVTFGATQRFPYTINHVFAGNGLLGGGSGGPIGSGVTLSIDPTMVATLGATFNTFTGVGTFSSNPGIFGALNATNSNTSSGDGIFASGWTGIGVLGTQTGVSASATGANSTGIKGNGSSYGGYFTNSSTNSGAVYAQNGSSGPALQASNSAYGTAAFITAVGPSSVSHSQLAHFNSALWADTSSMTAIIGSSDGYSGGSFFSNGNGYSTLTAQNFAVNGTALTASAPNVGIVGNGTGSGANPTGVLGNGVWGVEGAGTVRGVYGTANNFGLYGLSTGGSYTVGVYGQGGYGMQAGGSQYGIFAQAQTGANAIAGAYGALGGPSKTGLGTGYQVGVWADSNANLSDTTDFFQSIALLATIDNGVSGVFYNDSNSEPSIFAHNYGSGGGSLGLVLRAQGHDGICDLTTGGDASCTGTLKSVNTTSRETKVETYAVQSSENWMEDYGSGTLTNGAAVITIDSAFAETVNTGVDYHVFPVPGGDCKGLYVTRKTATSFEVHELGGGANSIPFDYKIVAKRRGHEAERLVDVTERERAIDEDLSRKPPQRQAEAPRN